MHHKASENLLACESCGHAITTNEDFTADSAETPFGPLLQSGRAHVWAASAHDIVCEQCGAHSLEPPGNKTQVCPYCGSNQLVESAQLSELIDPQVIGLFELEQDEAQRIVQSWLQEGFFTPDKMSNEAKKLELRPAYFPFWTFDGSVEVNWSAEVRENYTRGMYDNPEWQLVSGTETEFFDDVLVPGMTAMKFAELRRILPFKLKDVVRFEPAHLAGWNAMAYDRAISDASLLAREIVIRRLRPKMRGMIEQRKEKRNVSVGAGRWTGLSFKLAYLPIWVGTFKNGNDLVRVLVNGQTGKVGGKKPRDQVKVVGTWLIGLLFVILILIILFGFLTASLDTTRI